MPDGLVDPHTDLRTGVLRNLVGAGTWDGLRNAKGELVAMRTSEFLGGAPPGADGHTRWPEAYPPLAASGRVRLGGGGRDRRDPQGGRGGAVPPAFREHTDGHRMGAQRAGEGRLPRGRGPQAVSPSHGLPL